MNEFWNGKKRILVILAHPDDPEFFCGATIAKWVQDGHTVSYCLLTKGDKGVNENFKSNKNIREIRVAEQKKAASKLGVEEITFLDVEDGYVVPDLKLRRKITAVIRKSKPNIVVTCDPTNYFIRETYINHPDHRAAGQVTIDAVFPAAQNPYFFPELMANNDLSPHHVEEVWLSLAKEPNVILDVSDTWQQKVSALLAHQSQIGDRDAFIRKMQERHTEDSSVDSPRYEEAFRRIDLKK